MVFLEYFWAFLLKGLQIEILILKFICSDYLWQRALSNILVELKFKEIFFKKILGITIICVLYLDYRKPRTEERKCHISIGLMFLFQRGCSLNLRFYI